MRPRTSSTSASARVHVRSALVGRGGDLRVNGRVGVHGAHFRQSLGRHPSLPGAGQRDPRRAPKLRQPLEQIGGRIDIRFDQHAGGQQRVVQFVSVARIGTRFVDDTRDRVAVECAQLTRDRIAGAPRIHRMRAPLFEWRVIEKRVRPRVEELVRERRRFGRVPGDKLQLAAMDA